MQLSKHRQAGAAGNAEAAARSLLLLGDTRSLVKFATLTLQ